MCTFSDLHATTNGGITLLTANANIHDSIFSNCTSLSSGAGIYADDSHVYITNTLMQDINAEKSGAAISALNDADLDISHAQFLKCNSNEGAIIDLQNNSNLNMFSSIINEFTTSAIVGETANITLHDVNIWNGVSTIHYSPITCVK